jgi:ATP-dependent Clp endopeptidase proteolytic subunit ClpP
MAKTTNNRNRSRLVMQADGPKAEISMYGVIGWDDLTAKNFRDQLKALGEVNEIECRIHSEGGSIFDGLAIYNLLRDHKAQVTTRVDGMALSMASVIAMAGNQIEMAKSSLMMIHNPLNLSVGDAEEMRKTADLLDKLKGQLVAIYAERTGCDQEEVAAWMDAETWMTADEAVANGFCDRLCNAPALAAVFDPSKFQNVPQGVLESLNQRQTPPGENPVAQQITTPPALPATQPETPKPATFAELKAECVGADAGFLCAQMEANATLGDARKAWMGEQQTRLTAANAAAEAAKNQAAQKPGGVRPLGTGAGSQAADATGDAVAEFHQAVEAKMVAHKVARNEAALAVIRENPDLHERYVAAYNAQRRQPAAKK